jgi:hypothetical protein
MFDHGGVMQARLHSSFWRYLVMVVALIAAVSSGVICAAALLCQQLGLDHFAALTLDGDNAWYLDLSVKRVPEIQDEDLFYHNVGYSIAEARTADIVLLGPSFVSYAVDPELLRQFGDRHGIKIYNMAFIGIRSGEFSRQVIKRWNLHPKLWIINVDDQFVHFFNPSLELSIGPRTTPIVTVKDGRLRGWFTVAARNVRWRLENWWTGKGAAGVFRRADDGSVYLGTDPRYFAQDNSVLRVTRDQNCHTDAKTIALGRDYVKDIGGKSMFMLVPHSQYCPQQARELGEALGIEALLAPDFPYTMVDGGGHLDHKGAIIFTSFLLLALERSKTFQMLVHRQ